MDPYPVPALVRLRDQVNAAWPNRDKSSDGWIGDAAHQARKSDHNPEADGSVDALDITHDPKSGADMGLVAEAIRASRDHRVDYLIFNRRICSSSVSPWEWRAYTGSNPHTSHLHVSVLDEYQNDTTPWAIGSDAMPLFETKAPGIMRELIEALDIGTEDAAAILGNLGHECDGFRAHQQYGHTGASGAIGWAQWDGSRRLDFESWSARRGLDVRSDEANLGFLVYELTATSEARVLPLLRAAQGLREKTEVFCDVFERPGVKAYDSRYRYALRAQNAYGTEAPLPVPQPEPIPPLDGSITPDDLLGSVRPKTVTVRDTITSQIEGFPRGVVETTYVRQSVRFIPENHSPSLAGATKGTDIMQAFDGNKTYIAVGVFIAGVVAEVFLGVDVPGFSPGDNWLEYIMGALGLGFLRHGVAKT